MLQEQQQYMEAPKVSPDDLTVQHSIFSSYIIRPEELSIEEDLMNQYSNYREKQVRTSFCTLLKNKVSHCCTYSLAVFRQLWKQIIPEVIRGPVESIPDPISSMSTNKDASFFQEYFNKKGRFFLIVFDYQSQQVMEEAYEKSTFIVPDGLGIRISELSKNTNCSQWKIQGWTKLKQYSILFFKFDMFGNLRNFGHLSKQLIDAYKDDESFLTNYKSQLNDAYQHFEAMEKQFANSYLEKEDRMHFE